MAIDWRPGLLWQEFNKTYTDIVNCQIIPPPHHEWTVPFSFFFKKRDAFVEKSDYWFAEIYDQEVVGSDVYTIWLVWWDVVVTKNDDIIYQELKVDWRNYKFLFMWHVQWDVEDTWTDPNGVLWDINNWYNLDEQVLVDVTKNWVPNQYAWHYVYLTSNIWEWEVFRIDSNTATELFISSSPFIVLPNTWDNTWYSIYPTYWDTLCFLWADWVYVIHDFLTQAVPVDVKKMPRVNDPIDIISAKERLFWFDKDYSVRVSQEWAMLKWYFTWDSIVWNSFNMYNIMEYQDYVLILWPERIDIVREVKIQAGAITKSVFNVINVSKTHWIYLPNAFHVYNQWLYIFSQNKRFMAVTISPAWTDRFYVSEEKDQWIYMQKFFDLFDNTTWNTLNIKITDKNIFITYCNGSDTEIYVYELQFQWWHRWKSALKIRWRKYDWYWDRYFETDNTTILDDETTWYDQVIKYIIWENDIYSVKRHLLDKIWLWWLTTRWSYVNLNYHLWWVVERYTKNLEQMWYLVKLAAFSWDWTQWTTILGYSPTVTQSQALATFYAPSTMLEIPTWFFHELCIIEFIWGTDDQIYFWWYISWHEVSLPQITTQINVI